MVTKVRTKTKSELHEEGNPMDVTEIRRAIVDAQVRGKDTTDLEKKLRSARIDEATKVEVSELKGIADKRLDYRKKAKQVRDKVKAQGETIDRFLELRDSVAAPMKELIELANLAELIKAQLDCYAIPNVFAFSSMVEKLPKGYLPKNFTCPTLTMVGGLVPSSDKAAESLFHLKVAYGCLAGMEKTNMQLGAFQRKAQEEV